MFATLLALHPLTSLGLGFSIHPSTVIGIAALAALYVWRARKGPAGGPTTAQRAAFTSGLAVLFFTLNGPFHDLSDGYLFTVHMAQHLVLTMLVPPLLIAGTPGWMLRPALQVPRVFALARWVTRPVAAFAIFNITLVVWHLPPLYNLAMAEHPVHIVQHLCFLVSATIMWWPLMSTMPELPRLSYPQQNVVRDHDGAPHVGARDRAHLRRQLALSRVRERAADLGDHADRGPALWRTVDVDPRRDDLLRVRERALLPVGIVGGGRLTMQTSAPINEIAHVIQLAVAPVFLLSGVAALLGVLTNRLSRIIDRARKLEDRERAAPGGSAPELHAELRHLSERARLINWAISLDTLCALCICALVATLFIGSSLSAGVANVVSVLFILSMVALFSALLCFLREVYIATLAPPHRTAVAYARRRLSGGSRTRRRSGTWRPCRCPGSAGTR